MLDDLDGARSFTRVLFLEADEDTLLTRYKETRRRHPQARNGNVADGIRREQVLLAPIRDRADTVIDTTGLSAAALRRKVASEMLAPRRAGQARGHVRLVRPQARPAARRRPRARRPLPAQPALGGRPAPADRLRPPDRRVRRPRRAARRSSTTASLPLLDYLLPQYVAEGKSHLVVAIGCTGGRHRSVAIAEDLAAHFRDDGRFFVEVQHRDVDRAAARGPEVPSGHRRLGKGSTPCQYA